MNDRSWDKLIDGIYAGLVVPIVGSRLLVGADGQTSLQGEVARQLLEDYYEISLDSLNRPLPLFRELSEAVSIILTRKGSDIRQELYENVYYAIKSVIRPDGITPPAAPEPIRQLAQITGFRLYVTLTPDDLLAESLRKRCAVNEIVHSPNLPTSEGKDLPIDWKTQAGEAQLLYLFGKSSLLPSFAIHDEDLLEYAHNVISHGSQVPTGFLGELQQRNLLFVGCNFPDWLTRLFLRATNQKRLSEIFKRAWLIEPLQPEEPLTCFLRSYSKDTEVLSQNSPVEFVAELYKRWMAKYGNGPAEVESTNENVPPRAMFFISYSRQTDTTKAESLYQSLLKQGLTEGEVWYDRQAIEPGQNYQRRIVDGIRGCRYFLPVLSQAADGRDEAFVFREWREATDLREGKNGEFILPVIVDSDYHPTRYKFESVWQWRSWKIDFGHAPDGVPDDKLEAKLKKLVREARRVGESA